VLLKSAPKYFLELLSKYFRLKVEGAEHIPAKGAAIIASNHSGFSGLDALLLFYSIKKYRKRVPRIMAHRAWFANSTLRTIMLQMGFYEAKFQTSLSHLKSEHMIAIFPEGERGNFKPSSEMYQLQPFKTGAIRLALLTHAPIIPTIIVGAEESSLNFGNIKLPAVFKKMLLPIPINIIPIPARWKIKFLAPIRLPFNPRVAIEDESLVDELVEDLQEQMQEALNKELSKYRR